MRKIFLSMMALAAGVAVLHAEGHQLNLNSTRQAGMGNVGAALKLGAESMIYNPAGLSFINGKMDFSLGATGVISHVKFTKGSYTAETDNPMSTPLFVYAGMKLTKDLAVGVSLNNPAGNSITWPSDWLGAGLVQEASLKAFALQPTISYKLLNDKLSIGAGLMILWGDFSTSRLAAPLGTMTLEGNAKVGLGVNLGALYTFSPKWSVGLSYRSKIKMKVEDGDATLGPLAGDFSASMPMPANVNLGVSYKPLDKLLLSAELQWVGWGTYENLVIQFDGSITGATGQTVTQPKNYSNTMIYRIGGQYSLCDKFDVRAGFYYDTTPVNTSDYYSPETPGSNKSAFTAGATYRPTTKFAIDLACTYSNGAKTHGEYVLVKEPRVAFTGDYKVSAFLPSLSLRYTF